jgi:hypothetical protein
VLVGRLAVLLLARRLRFPRHGVLQCPVAMAARMPRSICA